MRVLEAIINTLTTFTMMIVYDLNEKLYSLILKLGDINLFSGDKFQALTNRVFMFAGIFMLFKLAISVINYVLDPDKLANSQSGAQKVVIRILIVLALLTSYDAIFLQALKFQQLVLQDGVLNKIIFGGTCDDETLTDAEKNTRTSNYISYTMIAPFIYYNDKAFSDLATAPEGCNNKNHTTPFNAAIGNMEICGVSEENRTLSLDDECYNAIWKWDTTNKNQLSTNDAATNENIKNTYREEFEKALLEYNLPKAWGFVAATKRNRETVFASSLFTPLLGLVTIVILFVICVRVAVRSIKLAFLRFVAPIPIISYIDIGSGNKGMFNKWIDTTVKTYLELFIQLLALYFAIYIISQFVASGSLTGYSGNTYSWKDEPMLNIFMLVACFMFALQMPKLIQDMTGLNTSGLTKIADRAKGIGSRAVNAVGAGALGAVGGLATGIAAGVNHGKGAGKLGHGVLSGITGALGGTVRGMGQGLGNDKISFKNMTNAAGNGIKATSDDRTAAWTPVRTVRKDANGNVVYKRDASGNLVFDNNGNAEVEYDERHLNPFVRFAERTIARPIATAANIKTNVQKSINDEATVYENEKVRLNSERSSEVEIKENAQRRVDANEARIATLRSNRDIENVKLTRLNNDLSNASVARNQAVTRKSNAIVSATDFASQFITSNMESSNKAKFDSNNGRMEFYVDRKDASGVVHKTTVDFTQLTYKEFQDIVKPDMSISNSIKNMSSAQFSSAKLQYQNNVNELSQSTIEQTNAVNNYNNINNEITNVNNNISNITNDIRNTQTSIATDSGIVADAGRNIDDIDRQLRGIGKAQESNKKNEKNLNNALNGK